ncbi:hypothetical protein HELRODRAFT_161872 [Helobdella robusta]|uniref:Uncharacterized protein n=1 Tax=Helobdella robusta TaxID=6412 RepID=T1ERZ6_HELRO|nr:hypothetical protein HELRODRAFT_161872 [Helobdella robusta]ESO02584.1 hypothetical protein HELRODRAFT_161872 [Helobdella robusta]
MATMWFPKKCPQHDGEAYTGKNSWTYKFSKTCFVRSDRPNKVLVAYNGDESLAKKFNHKQISIARKKVYNNEDSDDGEDEDGNDNNKDGDDEVDEASDVALVGCGALSELGGAGPSSISWEYETSHNKQTEENNNLHKITGV